jgi:hypothetical protein
MHMMDDLLGGKRKSNSQATQQVKAWALDVLQLEEDTSLMVTELRCTEPGCPPIETVIALLKASHPTRQYKIHKPVADITFDDVTALATVQPKLVSSTALDEHEKGVSR